MKNGVGYITFSDGLVHFLMRPDKHSTPVRFSVPAVSEADTVDAVLQFAAAREVLLTRVVVSMDARACLLKSYRFPLQNRRQIDPVVGFELEEDMPFEAEEVVSDYFRGAHGKGESSVCAAALKKEAVSSLLSVFSERGLEVEALNVDAAAFARTCCRLFPDQERSVGLDIGRSRILFCDLVHGKVRRLAVIPWGENALVESVARAGDLSPEEVDRLMVFADAHEQSEHHELLRKQAEAFLRRLLREVARQLGDDSFPGHFILSGEIVRMQGFREMFSEFSQSRLDIWDEVFFKPGEEIDEGQRGSGLASVYGTAQEGAPAFDLRRGEFALARANSGWRRDLHAAIVFLVFVCLAWGGFSYASLSAKERELSVLEQATRQVYLEVLPDVSSSLAPVQYQSILVSRLDDLRGTSVQGEEGGDQTVIEILRQMSTSLASDLDVEFLSLALDRKRIGCNGRAHSMAEVDKVRKAMAGTEIFREVKIRSAVADKRDGGVHFEIEVLR